MVSIDGADNGLGALWREVVNFLGDREITPADWLPLCDAVLPNWHEWPGYIGGAAGWLTGNRVEIENAVAENQIGWRLWTDHRDRLRAYAQKLARRPVTDGELQRWWLEGEGGEFAMWDAGPAPSSPRLDRGSRRPAPPRS